MTEISASQIRFLAAKKKHRRTVACSRLLIFVAFTLLWESAAALGLIDSFIFSSPSRIGRCFYQMVADRSLLAHIGITLFETIVSFLMVIVCALAVTILLWFSKKLSEDRKSVV